MPLFAKTCATFFGVGFFPAAPGTAATAVGAVLVFLLKASLFWYVLIAVILFALGVWASEVLEKTLNQKDPGIVVIDEVVGIMVALVGLPITWPVRAAMKSGPAMSTGPSGCGSPGMRITSILAPVGRPMVSGFCIKIATIGRILDTIGRIFASAGRTVVNTGC